MARQLNSTKNQHAEKLCHTSSLKNSWQKSRLKCDEKEGGSGPHGSIDQSNIERLVLLHWRLSSKMSGLGRLRHTCRVAFSFALEPGQSFIGLQPETVLCVNGKFFSGSNPWRIGCAGASWQGSLLTAFLPASVDVSTQRCNRE